MGLLSFHKRLRVTRTCVIESGWGGRRKCFAVRYVYLTYYPGTAIGLPIHIIHSTQDKHSEDPRLRARSSLSLMLYMKMSFPHTHAMAEWNTLPPRMCMFYHPGLFKTRFPRLRGAVTIPSLPAPPFLHLI